jgi:hypothetical protein
MKPPYPGQGNPLPPSLGKGQWVVENAIFLSDEPYAPPPAPEKQSTSAMRSLPHGAIGLCFEAAHVATVMRISVEDLLEANQAGKLAVSNWEVTPKPGDRKAMRYRFSLDVRHFDATIGYGPSWAGLRPAKPILFLRALCASVTRPIRPHGTPVSSGSGQVRSRHDGR